MGLSQTELKDRRALLAGYRKGNPEWRPSPGMNGAEMERLIPLIAPITDEDLRLILLPSKEFADHWRKAEPRPVPDLVRRQYACFALMALIDSENFGLPHEPSAVAKEAFRYADAMIEAESAEEPPYANQT